MSEDQDQFRTVRGYQLQEQACLTHSMEDYMEMIYRQCTRIGYSRINTLAQDLDVQAPSATKMVQKLAELGLVHYEKYGIIYLTNAGLHRGKYLLFRHQTVQEFLDNLCVEEEKQLRETELLEHNVSPETLQRLERLNSFFAEHPDILTRLRAYLRQD